MELLPLAVTSGWTSGIAAYATVLVLGPLGRFAGIEEVPGGLERADERQRGGHVSELASSPFSTAAPRAGPTSVSEEP